MWILTYFQKGQLRASVITVVKNIHATTHSLLEYFGCVSLRPKFQRPIKAHLKIKYRIKVKKKVICSTTEQVQITQIFRSVCRDTKFNIVLCQSENESSPYILTNVLHPKPLRRLIGQPQITWPDFHNTESYQHWPQREHKLIGETFALLFLMMGA